MPHYMLRLALCVFAFLLLAGIASAGEKALMHCFYFTPNQSATQADWDAFYKATDALPGKINGITHVWYGKLRRPAAVFTPADETRKTITRESTEATGKFDRRVRSYGVCMEMKDEEALKTYANDPAHKAWEEVYFKVRQPETTTFDIIAQ